MGCATSKLDDLPAVALCRERCNFLDEAIHQRYVLAEAHLAYIQSLKGIGLSLHHFFAQDLDFSKAPLSPLVHLPPHKKGDPITEPSGPPPPHHSHSNSGSHLQFHSDSDDDDSASGSLHHHSHNSSPLHLDYASTGNYQALDNLFPGASFMNMNYMKNQTTPSVVYEQRPMSPGTVHTGESSYHSYPYPNNNPSSSPYQYYGGGYPSYGGGASGGFFGSAPPYGGSSSSPIPPRVDAAASSSSKPPPPPPSPPRGSAWDFLNPFETFEKYYPPYTPSRNSKDVRDEEGIPDLEDEDYQQEVVKEVHGDQKFVVDGSKSAVQAEDDDRESRSLTGPSVSVETDRMEYEVHTLENKVGGNEEKSEDHRGNVAAFKAAGGGIGGSRAASEVMVEIQVQFERASGSGDEFAKMLEVGKLPYHPKKAAYQVSSKMLHVITPSLSIVSSQPSTSKSAEASSSTEKAGSAYLDLDEDVGMRSGNLSSTLHKLYLWEKKLYDEVKAEEKMRVIHERKCRRLKRLDERGAEAHKVDSTRTLIRSLSTKIKIAIQVVDKISAKINKLRDEELWPQINEFIQGLSRMWKSMLECHRSQCQAIKCLDAIASRKKLGDAHLDAALQLERELLSWTLRFSSWIGAQKGYVRALNNWLLKCLMYEPEETPDGIAPFSPGRIGAPPVFVICNQWSQAMERISEKEVVESMRVFALGVLQLWEQDKLEMRQKMLANKDMERRVKNLEREDQKIQKEFQALDKKMVLVSGDGNGISMPGHIVYQGDVSNIINSLQMSLQNIFEAMEKFTANSMRAYEELLQRIEEERLAQEQPEVS